MEYINHSFIKPNTIQSRVYQQILYASAIKQNSLIVLPTGLGKTIVIIMVIANFLKKYPEQKVVITAPTRPLVDQHLETCKEFINIDEAKIIELSGSTPPPQRKILWENGRIFITTPQTLRNDIVNNICDLKTISLICFDEAHRAVGDDPYVLSAQQYRKINPKGRILGFTASPGKKEKILEILNNLHLQNIEYMDEEHPQVKPYIHNTNEQLIIVELPPEFQQIIHQVQALIKDYLSMLKEMGIIDSIQIAKNPKKKILQIPKFLNAQREELEDTIFFNGMMAYGQLMLLYQAIEMLEIQGLKTFVDYIEAKIEEYKRTNKSSLRRFISAPQIRDAYQSAQDLLSRGINHPKLTKMLELVKNQINRFPNSRILIFSNYKSTTDFLVNQLNNIEGAKPHRFVGQATSQYGKGLTQKQQKQVMDNFRSGIYDILVSTSVGEEGLDVAQCDLVIFYDMTPSATRFIQRRGRTGRAREGNVIILISKGTKDEAYLYSTKRQKQQIRNNVNEIKRELNKKKPDPDQDTLSSYFENEKPVIQNEEDQITIIIDHREKGSAILRNLLSHDIAIHQQQLPIGDFVLSSAVAVERKTTNDFVQSLIRGDLFEQLKQLKTTYEKPILLIEGTDLYGSGISPAAIRGALASILVDFAIPIIQTDNPKESVQMLVTIAKREQREKKDKPRIRSASPHTSIKKEQLFLLSSLPKIDHTLAERISEYFSTPRDFFNASQDELRKIKGIGPSIADRIDQLLSTPFDEED